LRRRGGRQELRLGSGFRANNANLGPVQESVDGGLEDVPYRFARELLVPWGLRQVPYEDALPSAVDQIGSREIGS
jgi:hypothetical protein